MRASVILKVTAAVACIVAPWMSTGSAHPLLDGWTRLASPQPETPAMEDFLHQVDHRLDDDVELALWWSNRNEGHLRTLGHWWAAASYQLAPRRVYPLLSVDEVRQLPRIAPDLRAFLIERSSALVEDRFSAPVAVASWGPPTPCLVPPFPELTPIFEDYVGCLLIPERH